MANRKTGFTYFRVYTDKYTDPRIKKLKRKMGCEAIAVHDYLMCLIFQKHGCYVPWDDTILDDVAEYLQLSEERIISIVMLCCQLGLFDGGMYESQKVLTSGEIQVIFLDMCKAAKRLDRSIPERLRIDTEESAKLLEEFKKATDESVYHSPSLPQSKVKERKVDVSADTPEAAARTPAKKYRIEECMQAALSDTRWAMANFATTGELMSFNKDLERQGIYHQSIPGYKKHFSFWKKRNGFPDKKMVL